MKKSLFSKMLVIGIILFFLDIACEPITSENIFQEGNIQQISQEDYIDLRLTEIKWSYYWQWIMDDVEQRWGKVSCNVENIGTKTFGGNVSYTIKFKSLLSKRIVLQSNEVWRYSIQPGETINNWVFNKFLFSFWVFPGLYEVSISIELLSGGEDSDLTNNVICGKFLIILGFMFPKVYSIK